MSNVTMSRARQELPEIVNRVASGGDRVVISRSGKRVAAVISIEDLARLQSLEDQSDAKAARTALSQAKSKGTISWTRLKAESGI